MVRFRLHGDDLKRNSPPLLDCFGGAHAPQPVPCPEFHSGEGLSCAEEGRQKVDPGEQIFVCRRIVCLHV